MCLVCIDALMNLFDKDIENIKFIYNFIETDTKMGRFYGHNRKFREACKKHNVE